MQKAKRLAAVQKIISGEIISSHEMLLKKLRLKGITCTQATLSRDLRQLGAGRVPDGKGAYRYALPGSNPGARGGINVAQLLPVVTGIVDAKEMIVIRTLPGNANNVAIYLDNASRYEIAGTIAGDDTILVIPRNGISSSQAHSCLENILPGLHAQLNKK